MPMELDMLNRPMVSASWHIQHAKEKRVRGGGATHGKIEYVELSIQQTHVMISGFCLVLLLHCSSEQYME